MKKIIPAFLALALSLTLFSCSQKAEGDGTMADHIDINTLENDSLDVSIEVPDTWHVSSESFFGDESRHYTSPTENSKDNFLERISIISGPVSEGTTLESFTENNVDSCKFSYPDFKEISAVQKVAAGEFEASNFVFSYSQGALEIVVDLTFVVTNDKAYMITCNATSDSYEAYRDIFVKARETFKIN